ncbi:MAG: ribosome biogenesis GTPase Der [Chloroflexi bacterium]|nr:ribosome biogenesis GTPase Der [Chloroflexota bacterium]
MAYKALVALVGRPNVGKSTLFNHLIGERRAIVEDLPGTTRDRLYGQSEWLGRNFAVVDTGGLVLERSDSITEQVRVQAQLAIEEADVIVFVVDVTEGLIGTDFEIAELLRRTNKLIVLAVNKVDNPKRGLELAEFYQLGLGEPFPVSALRGQGVADLLDQVIEVLPKSGTADEDDQVLHIALVGKTNVGKSSLLNRMIGEERVIVSDVPGTTRDAVDTHLRYYGKDIVLIDTAGIRRRGSIARGIEKYSVLRAFRAIDRADLVLFVIDASAGITAQDAHIAGYVMEQFKSAAVLVNKWDLVPKETNTQAEFEAKLRGELRFLSFIPILYISALTGQRTERIMPLVLRIHESAQTRLSTSEINAMIRDATAKHSPPTQAGKKLRFYYGSQASSNPPTIVFFVNDTELVHFSYQRYLENQIRERYPFEGTPIRLIFRGHDDETERSKR